MQLELACPQCDFSCTAPLFSKVTAQEQRVCHRVAAGTVVKQCQVPTC